MTQSTRRSMLYALSAVITLVFAPARSNAQQPVPTTPRAERSSSAVDSVSAADIERAARDLSIAVEAAVRKATEDPELKIAALKVATNAVSAAQVIITQQTATLEAVLERLSREIASATARQTKPKTH